MSVARTHHTKDYTCMSNYHFKDKSLSLKAKGLLSLMLSLSETWDYSVAGLATLSSDGETSVRTAVRELEEHKYLVRTPIRDGGRIVDWEYDIYEKPFDLLEVEIQQVETLALENTPNKVNKQSNTKKENKVLSKDNTTEFSFGKQKPKKQNLYSKCVSLINNKTNDKRIRELLINWLNMLLEKYKDRGKVLYTNVFSSKLGMLDKFDEKDWQEIIEYNLQKGYEGFYPINNYSNYKDKRLDENMIHVPSMTEKDYREEEILRAELEKKGVRTTF